MYKVTVITDPEMADGFRLAGVEVVAVSSIPETTKVLNALFDEDNSGIIALDLRLEEAIDARLQRRIDAAYRPMLVMLPLRDRLDSDSGATERLARMIRRAVGFDVTLKRG